ncbi:hypothetical protein DY000_02002313 [Brassica cretica]|uniref:Uncharacterized protein n=1 Tax=Brassica cretica TaxID=69181 RepID=A0ABQ7C4P9_BRACR|nr:hypothetical protein DY000_02002313 [Brassica cretica]
MVLMVTAPPSCIRPPPHPPSLPCKPLPLEACSLIIFPEPPDPTAALIRLLAPLHILEPSVSSPVHVVAVTPLSFFATTKGLTRSVFEPLFVQKVFSVSSCNKPYMDEYYLVLGISCVKMNHLPQNEDVALSLNLLLPLVEDVTSSLPLPQYEDLTLPHTISNAHNTVAQEESKTHLPHLPSSKEILSCCRVEKKSTESLIRNRYTPLQSLFTLYEVRIRTFVLSALVSMVAEIDAFKNGGFGWYTHGMYVAHGSQCSILYAVSTFAVQTLTMDEFEWDRRLSS